MAEAWTRRKKFEAYLIATSIAELSIGSAPATSSGGQPPVTPQQQTDPHIYGREIVRG